MFVVEKIAIQHREQVQTSTSTVLLCLFEINIFINSKKKIVLLNEALNSCSGVKYSCMSVSELSPLQDVCMQIA